MMARWQSRASPAREQGRRASTSWTNALLFPEKERKREGTKETKGGRKRGQRMEFKERMREEEERNSSYM